MGSFLWYRPGLYQCRFRAGYEGPLAPKSPNLLRLVPAFSSSTGQNRQHNCFPSTLLLLHRRNSHSHKPIVLPELDRRRRRRRTRRRRTPTARRGRRGNGKSTRSARRRTPRRGSSATGQAALRVPHSSSSSSSSRHHPRRRLEARSSRPNRLRRYVHHSGSG